jgi:hypothetical protein
MCLDAYLLFQIVVAHGQCELSNNKVERDEHELVLEVFVLVELLNHTRAQGLRVGKVLDQDVVPRFVDLSSALGLHPDSIVL